MDFNNSIPNFSKGEKLTTILIPNILHLLISFKFSS